MSDVGKKWVKSFIIGLIVAVTGSAGIGTLVSSISDVASGTPIQSVVKDIAVDTAKDAALDTLYGSEDDNDSISHMFDKNKYKYVSDKKSGPIGWIAPGWYAEVYRINTDAYIGNRKYNDANGVNMKWNMVNATDFEIGNFKKTAAYSESYVAYDSNTFKLIFSELNKGRLDGFTLVYDEYYNTYELIEYKKGKETGYKITETDGQIYYIKNDENIAVYNENSNKFEHFSSFGNKQPELTVSKNGNETIYNCGEYEYRLYTGQDYIEYKSNVIDFKGNAFSFVCNYNYSEEEKVTYTFETMYRLGIECTDGTIGEVLVLEEGDTSEEAITAKSISIALMKIGAHATVDVLVSGDLAMLDTAVELATGQSISDRLNYEIDNIIDDAFDEESELNQTIDNVGEALEDITDPDDYRSWEDRIEDAFEDGEENEDTSDMFNESNKEVDENGQVYYTLPNGIKVTFGENEDSTEVIEDDTEVTIEEEID